MLNLSIIAPSLRDAAIKGALRRVIISLSIKRGADLKWR
jgi:hypothetical protein